MGNTESRAARKIKVPPNHELIKIGTLNLNIKKSLNVSAKIERVVDHIIDLKNMDIICLQGIHDQYSLHAFVQIFKNHPDRGEWSILPEIDDYIITEGKSLSLSRGLGRSHRSHKNSLSLSGAKRDHYRYASLILTRLRVADYFVEKIGVDQDDDYLNDVYLLCVNIILNQNMISIYNVLTTPDSSFFSATNLRDKQMKLLRGWYLSNRKNKGNRLHLLCGSLGIPEMDHLQLNPEYLSLINDRYLIDLYRTLNADDPGYTSTDGTREDYQMILCTEDEHNELVSLITGSKDDETRFIQALYQKFGTYPVQVRVIEAVKMSPTSMVEVSLMIKNNDDKDSN